MKVLCLIPESRKLSVFTLKQYLVKLVSSDIAKNVY